MMDGRVPRLVNTRSWHLAPPSSEVSVAPDPAIVPGQSRACNISMQLYYPLHVYSSCLHSLIGNLELMNIGSALNVKLSSHHKCGTFLKEGEVDR